MDEPFCLEGTVSLCLCRLVKRSPAEFYRISSSLRNYIMAAPFFLGVSVISCHWDIGLGVGEADIICFVCFFLKSLRFNMECITK